MFNSGLFYLKFQPWFLKHFHRLLAAKLKLADMICSVTQQVYL